MNYLKLSTLILLTIYAQQINNNRFCPGFSFGAR